MRIALIHDCIVHVGGAERVLQNLHAIYPEAPVYTLISDARVAHELLPGAEIHTSFAQHMPFSKRFFRAYFPIYPMAVESFDLRGFDVILSSSFAFAKGIIPPPGARHICYCYSPLRYLWSEYHFHRSTVFRQSWKRLATDPLMSRLRMWDRLSADRVDDFIAISRVTADRIAKYYRRDSTIIHPPVRVSGIQPAAGPGDYFLLVSRLMRYKRVDAAIDAFNGLGLALKIVGVGPELAELRRQAKPSVELLGGVSDARLAELYAGCRAFVFPAIEDFGIVMVEAQAYGKPVIACAGGGAAEIVLDGATGVLFREQTPESLAQAVERFENSRFEISTIHAHAMKFDETVFHDKIRQFVQARLGS